jgi:uncharacterized protein YggE
VAVVGIGSAAAAPDVLVLQLGTEVRHPDVATAFWQAGAALAAMVARLRAAGVADADLRTTGAALRSYTDHQGQPAGHAASQQLTARLRDLAGAPEVIAEVVRAGGAAVRVHGLAFEIDEESGLRKQARERAFADARAKAEQYAALAGRTLGPVRRVSEDPGGGWHPQSMLTETFSLGAAESMPVEAGSQQVTVTVGVEWTFAG